MHRQEDRLFRLLSRRVVALVLAGACAALLLSCQGAGDGGVGDTNSYLNRGVTVTPDSFDPATVQSYVTILETAGDATSTCIGVDARRLSDVFSVVFSLTYDPTALRFTGFDASTSCLGTIAVTLTPQVDAGTTPGRLVVGFTRNAATTSTGVNGCGHIIDLCFDVIGTSTFDMDFTGNLAVLKPDGSPVADLGTNWVGGQLVVRQ